MEQIKEIYGIKDIEEEFKVEAQTIGNRYILQQMYQGIEVYGREVVVLLNNKNGDNDTREKNYSRYVR